MSLFLVLSIIFFLIFLYPIVMIWQQYRRMRNRFSDMFGSSKQKSSNSNKGRHRNYNEEDFDEATGRHKIFSQDEGEYVDFEDINDEHTTQAQTTKANTQTAPEPQISDAEFEEIN